MKRFFIVSILALALAFGAAGVTDAATIDFEGMPQDYWYFGGQQNFGNYWAGVFFGPDSTILETNVYGYNSGGYPPHSGDAVLFSINTPYIDATFDNPVNFVSLWYTSASDFVIDAYDSGNNLIASITGGSNYGLNSYLEISRSDSDIKWVKMHDSGNYFTIDDFSAPILTGNPRQVPEPSTMLLLGSGLLGMVAAGRRFRK